MLTLCRRDIRGIRGSGAQRPSGQDGQMQIVEPANGINLPLPCKGGKSCRLYSPAVSRTYSTPSTRTPYPDKTCRPVRTTCSGAQGLRNPTSSEVQLKAGWGSGGNGTGGGKESHFSCPRSQSQGPSVSGQTRMAAPGRNWPASRRVRFAWPFVIANISQSAKSANDAFPYLDDS